MWRRFFRSFPTKKLRDTRRIFNKPFSLGNKKPGGGDDWFNFRLAMKRIEKETKRFFSKLEECPSLSSTSFLSSSPAGALHNFLEEKKEIQRRTCMYISSSKIIYSNIKLSENFRTNNKIYYICNILFKIFYQSLFGNMHIKNGFASQKIRLADWQILQIKNYNPALKIVGQSFSTSFWLLKPKCNTI